MPKQAPQPMPVAVSNAFDACLVLDQWAGPWHQLLHGDMDHSEQLSTIQRLKALYD